MAVLGGFVGTRYNHATLDEMLAGLVNKPIHRWQVDNEDTAL